MTASRLATATVLLTMLLGGGAIALGGQAVASDDAATRMEDLATFKRDFFLVDQSYRPAARAEAAKRLDAVSARLGTISQPQFILALEQVVALADNGHTLTIARGSDPGMRRVGIRLAPFGEEFYVLRAVPDHASLLGAQLVGIDGTPLAVLRDSARTLAGGINSWRDRQAPPFLESPGQLHALGLARSAAQASYRFKLRDGSVRDVVLGVESVPPDPPGRGSAAILAPLDAGGAWRSLLAPGQTPWALQEWGTTMRRRDAPELDAMIIQLRANVDGAQPIVTFLEESNTARQTAGRKNLVLDMRLNGGGNLQLTRDWMSGIAARLPAGGRVVVLTSPWTFSAAISSTGYLKQGGGSRVILVGEAPGDRLNFFAEGQPVRLPRSGAMFLVATQRHDYQGGCRGYSDCHGPVIQYPIAVSSLAPDVPAPWTLASYAAGRDPAMEAVSTILHKSLP